MRIGPLLLVLLGIAQSAAGQDWVRRMFDHTEFNFGTIARGAKAEHRFTVENVYKEDARIVSVTSTCGCTKPTATKTFLRSLEKAEIVATIDTRSFIGPKEAAVKIRFDLPFPAEMILKVSCYIRSDVVVQPGVIDLGSVPQGSPAEREVSIDYAGRSDWQIVAVEVSNPSLEVQLFETARLEGQIKYRLIAKLRPNTPPGYVKDQLVLVTNDLNYRTARVPVPVEASVVPAMTIRPSPLMLGVVSAGQTITKYLVAQSQNPFHVRAVRTSDPRFHSVVPPEAKALHLIPVTFTADERAGNVSEVIHIETDASGGATDVAVQVCVVDAANDGSSATKRLQWLAPSTKTGSGTSNEPAGPAPVRDLGTKLVPVEKPKPGPHTGRSF